MLSFKWQISKGDQMLSYQRTLLYLLAGVLHRPLDGFDFYTKHFPGCFHSRGMLCKDESYWGNSAFPTGATPRMALRMASSRGWT